MKKFVFLFIVCLGMFSSNIFSKDYIIRNNGQKIDCTAITGEDSLNIYFQFYGGESGEVELNSLLKKSDVKEYNFSNRDEFLQKQKIEAKKRENEKLLKEKRLREKKERDSLAVVDAKLLEVRKLKEQKEKDSLQAKKRRLETEYKASNNITYHIGDSVILGEGSMPNGNYKYLQMGGWAAGLSYDPKAGNDQFNIGRGLSGVPVIIKKIKSGRINGKEIVWFVVDGGNITSYTLNIEGAIYTCEVKLCNNNIVKTNKIDDINNKYEQLKKLKELYDSGILTKEEFDSEKEKILKM